LSYGLGFLVHAVSTLATYRELLAPFGDNHMYLAALPVLAAFATLFLLRRRDSLWSLDTLRAGLR
jgi:putative oxidoreductase